MPKNNLNLDNVIYKISCDTCSFSSKKYYDVEDAHRAANEHMNEHTTHLAVVSEPLIDYIED